MRSSRPFTVHERTGICKSQLEAIIENPGNTRGAEQTFGRWFADGYVRLKRRIQSCSLMQKGKSLDMTTALGFKPDTSNTKLQINFSCLISRFFIWACKLKKQTPSLSHFLRLLKKTHKIETNQTAANILTSDHWQRPSLS